ncbi:hypothetical protein Gpo141_00010285 [Globisporangium polare]
MSNSGSSSAWEQWGNKRPAAMTTTAGAAFQSLLSASPLAAMSSGNAEGSTAASASLNAAQLSLKKMWVSARDVTMNAVQGGAASPASSSASTSASSVDLEAMESGQQQRGEAEEQESATATWPLFRRKSNTENSLLPAMSWNTRFKYFVAMTLMGLMFFGMASIFLPLIMIRPSKFALSFMFGSMCLMTAFAMLKGPGAFLAGLLEPKRLALTTAYFFSLGATLYSCLVLGNYVLVVCTSVMQLITLGVFAMAVLPGGNASLKAFGVLFTKAARQMIQALRRLFR